MSPEDISQELRIGLKEINADIVSSFAGLLETDEYVVNLLQFIPEFKDPNLTEKQKRAYDYITGDYGKVLTEFFMGRRWDFDENGSIGEIVLPLTSTKKLDQKTVMFYKEKLRNGHIPTAVAYSYVESRHPAAFGSGKLPDFGCLTHFMLDGHHKMFAAAELKKPISLLSFLSKKRSQVIEFHRESRKTPLIESLREQVYELNNEVTPLVIHV